MACHRGRIILLALVLTGCENTEQMAWSQGCVDTCARVFISEASDAEFAKGDSKYDACAKKCFPGPEDPFDGLLH